MRKNFLSWGSVTFVIFILFSFLIQNHFLGRTDIKTTIFLQKVVPRFFDTSFSIFSLIGSAEIATIILLFIFVIRKNLNLIFILFTYAILHVLELLGKFFIIHPGPTLKFLRYDIPFSFPTSGIKPGYSYPSGHMARTAFLSAIILVLILKSKKLSKNKKLAFFSLLILFNIVMLVSRVYLGEHWLSDVIGGGLLGFALGLLAFLV